MLNKLGILSTGILLAGLSNEPMQGYVKHGKSSMSGRMKTRTLNPQGYRGKPTKRRLKVKLARKAKLRNQKK